MSYNRSKMGKDSITFTLSASNSDIRQWDIIKRSGLHGCATGIVLKKVIGPGLVTTTIYPYKVPKNKLWSFLKFQWLKLRVFLKIIG